MERTIEVEVSLNGLEVQERPIFCQGDKNTHFLSVRFMEDVDLTGYTLQVYYLPPYPSVTPYVDLYSEITSSPFKVPIPNKILERNGQVKVEFSLSKESELITVNKTFNFEVIRTMNGTGVTAYPEGTLKETIAQQIEKIKALLAQTDEKINEYNNNATEKTNKFDENARTKTNEFNSNSNKKLEIYNDNAKSETTKFNKNAESETAKFNENSDTKTADFDLNAQKKTTDFDNNYSEKLKSFDSNSDTKTTDFNNNALKKTQNFNENAKSETTKFDKHVSSTLEVAYSDLDKKANESALNASVEANELVKAQEAKSLEAIDLETNKQLGTIRAKSIEEQGYLHQQSNAIKKETSNFKDQAILEMDNKKTLFEETANQEAITLNKEGKRIVTELEVLLNGANVINIVSLLGNSYKGVFNPEINYIDGDVYYKKDSNTISLEIPNTSGPALAKNNQKLEVKKFYKIIAGLEKEVNLMSNDDNSVVGFQIDNSLKVDRINSSIIFEMSIINHTVSFEIQDTNSPELIKTMTALENNPIPVITKIQRDRPICSSLTQRETNLRKFNY